MDKRGRPRTSINRRDARWCRKELKAGRTARLEYVEMGERNYLYIIPGPLLGETQPCFLFTLTGGGSFLYRGQPFSKMDLYLSGFSVSISMHILDLFETLGLSLKRPRKARLKITSIKSTK